MGPATLGKGKQTWVQNKFREDHSKGHRERHSTSEGWGRVRGTRRDRAAIKVKWEKNEDPKKKKGDKKKGGQERGGGKGGEKIREGRDARREMMLGRQG